MGLRSNIFRRNSVWYFRIRVPADLHPSVTDRKELKRSLATGDAAVARRRGARALAAAHDLFDELRCTRGMDRTEIERLVRRLYELKLEEDHQRRLRVHLTRGGAREHAELMANRAAYGRGVQHGLAEARYDVACACLDDIKATLGTRIDLDTPNYQEFLFQTTRALAELNRAYSARDRGDFTYKPTDPLFAPLPASVEAGGSPGPSASAGSRAEARVVPVETDPVAMLTQVLIAAFSQSGAASTGHPAATQMSAPSQRELSNRWRDPFPSFLEDFIADRKKDEISDKTLNDYRSTFRLLEQVIGPLPLNEITGNHIIAFRRKLEEAPARMKNLGTDNIEEAIRRNAARKTPFGKLDPKTINEKYLYSVRAFFTWAQEERYYDPDRPNPGQDVRARGGKGKGQTKARLPFAPAQLEKIFASRLFTRCRSLRHFDEPGDIAIRNHRFWIIPLMLYTGARPDELGKLLLSDVRMRLEGRPLPHLDLLTDDVDGDEDDDPGEENLPTAVDERRTRQKTPAGRRKIPLHPELTRMGFLEYAEDMRRSPDNTQLRLFPEWGLGDDGTYSKEVSPWFNRTFLPRCGVKGPRLVLYSLRHNFKDLMRRSRIDPEIQNRIIGHRSGHVSETYGSGTLLYEQAREFLDTLKGPEGLTLSHIRYRPE